jgi:glutamate/tyrosine decarboxylase-like PLP-dependent enzyme
MNRDRVLDRTFDLVRTYVRERDDPAASVVDYRSPSELADRIDFEVADRGVSDEEFLELCERYLQYSVRTGHRRFLNQLYGGFNLPGFVGEVITSLANTSMYTYEVAPVATEVEKRMISLLNRYVGYAGGDGVFLTGGSNANLVAMFTARNRALPESREQGYDRGRKLTAFISEQAHYSFDVAANLLGIGTAAMIRVRADGHGRMIPAELEAAVRASRDRGEMPFFVGATCATTLLGAYDPLDELAGVCREHGLWLHADGSFGGSILLSDEHRHLARGSERTDSFSWNPHKLMNVPLTCSTLLVRERGVLERNLTSMETGYLFHDPEVGEDLGRKSIQCGRRVDAVKLWMAWKVFGTDGYRQRTDHQMAMAAHAEQRVRQHPKLEMMAPRQSFTVCFRYHPDGETDLDDFNLRLREALRKSGRSLVNYARLGEALVIRLVAVDAELDRSDIDGFFDLLLDSARLLERERMASV